MGLGEKPKSYSMSEDRVNKKLEETQRRELERVLRIEKEKEEELRRRRIYAKRYEPKQCMGDPVTGDICTRLAPPGSSVCEAHGGTSRAMREAAKIRLLALVEPAILTLRRAMASNDLQVAVRAATVLLDRSGYGPKATLEVDDKHGDEELSGLSDSDLLERHRILTRALMKQGLIGDNSKVIEAELVPPKSDKSVH